MESRWSRLKNVSQNEQAFSLTELMVVVAVMGILMAISIPSFQRYQLQAYQSEAKTELSALYTAEAAFKLDWGTYYANFTVIGYHPKGELAYTTGFHQASGCSTEGCWGEAGSGGAMVITNGKKIVAPNGPCPLSGDPSSPTDESLDQFYGFTAGQDSGMYDSIVNTGKSDPYGACRGDTLSFGCSFVGAADSLKAGTAADELGDGASSKSVTCARSNKFVAGSIGKLKDYDKWIINQSKKLEHLKNGL